MENSFLYVKTGKSKMEVGMDYQTKMVLNNDIPTLLNMETDIFNNKVEFRYNITSLYNVRKKFKDKKAEYEDVLLLIEGIVKLSEDINEYLISFENIIFDLSFVYINPDDNLVKFLFFPKDYKKDKDRNNDDNGNENEGKDTYDYSYDIREYFKELSGIANHDDMRVTKLVFGFLGICEKEDFVFYDIIKEFEKLKKDMDVSEKYIYERYDGNYNEHYSEKYGEKNNENEKINMSENDEFDVDFNGFYRKNSGRHIGLISKIKNMVSESFSSGSIYNEVKDKEQSRSRTGKIDIEIDDSFYFDNKDDADNIDDIDNIGNDSMSNGCDGDKTVFIKSMPNEGRRLISIDGKENIIISKTPFYIGKDKTSVDGFINKNSVSRIHGVIYKESEEYFLEDQNTTNGTYVNGEMINPYEEVLLGKDDVIRFGDVEYVFK